MTRITAVCAAVCAAVYVSVCVLATDLIAQPTPGGDSVTNRRVIEAISSAMAGDTARALDLLEKATDESPKHVDALYWRGLLMSRSTELSLDLDIARRVHAWRLLSKAADLDPDNPRYPLELGRIRLKSPFLRLDAERLFKRALALAEASGSSARVAEVAWELGRIFERRWFSQRDRVMVQQGFDFRPDLAIGILHYTREFIARTIPLDNPGEIDRRRAEEYFQLAVDRDPTNGLAALGLAGLQYDLQRYEEMLDVVGRSLRARAGARAEGAHLYDPAGAGQRAYRSTIPLDGQLLLAAGLAEYRRTRFAEADSLFTAALRSMPDSSRRAVTSLEEVLTKAEAARYTSLDSAARRATDAAFWDGADPLRTTPWNEARIEFLARLAWAQLRFSDADLGRDGWRTDRGLIALRYGEPPTIVSFPPVTQNNTVQGIDAVSKVVTVWFYPKSELTFVFNQPPGMNYASFAGDFRFYTEGQRDVVPLSFDNVRTMTALDSVDVQVVRLRGSNPLAVDVRSFADIPVRRLYATSELVGGRLTLAHWIRRNASDSVFATERVRVRPDRDIRHSAAWADTVAPGLYELRVEATDLSAGVAARARNELYVEPFVPGIFGVSDLLLADRVVPREGVPLPRGLDDFRVAPRGALRIAPRDTFALYFETYGLTPKDAEVSYRVQLTVTLEALDRGDNALQRAFGRLTDLVGLSPVGEDQLGLSFERTEPLGNRDRVPTALTVGLGDAPAGRYSLRITVTDLATGNDVTTRREFFVTRGGRTTDAAADSAADSAARTTPDSTSPTRDPQ